MTFILPNAKIVQDADVPYGDLKIKKTDDATPAKALANAEFHLTGTGYSETLKSDASGVITFGKLKAGTYTLTETQAPTGYQKLSGTWTITVQNDDDNENAFVSGVTGTVDSSKWSWDGTKLELTIKNPANQKVVKIFKGLTQSEMNEIKNRWSPYQIYIEKDSKAIGTLKLADKNCVATTQTTAGSSTTNYIYTWTLDDRTAEAGVYKVSEDNEDIEMYTTQRSLWSNANNKKTDWDGNAYDLTIAEGDVITLQNEYVGAKIDIKKYGSVLPTPTQQIAEKTGSEFTITKGTWKDVSGVKTFVKDTGASASTKFDPSTYEPEYGYKDPAGQASRPYLAPGDYVLEETKAPTGFSLLTSKIYIRVAGTEVKLVDESGNVVANVQDMWMLEEEKTGTVVTGYVLRIKNPPLYSLPSTGGIGIYWTTLLGVLLMLYAMFLADYKRQRMRRRER